MKVPFIDLVVQYKDLKTEILASLESVMGRAAFILGDEVTTFEEGFASYCDVGNCIGVASGTDALVLAIKACGFGPGDEIITVANTFIATTMAISAAGATPVLVDCRDDCFTMDVDALSCAVTSKTRAIMPVHLYGQTALMDPILEIAQSHDLTVIEDAAQAHGACYQGARCGSLGNLACFSFYPGKNLGAYGDGGAVVTDDRELADRVRMIRNYGQEPKNHHQILGVNSRLDTLQAAVLNIKLRKLDQWNHQRLLHADAYRKGLAGLPVQLPVARAGNSHVYHLFVIRTPKRRELSVYLDQHGISCGMHYPIPIHLQPAYQHLGYEKGSFPVSEALAEQCLSLPMYPELQSDQIEFVCAKVREFFD